MKIYVSEMRAAGRADLSGRWGESAMLTFVAFIISQLFNASVGGVFNRWYIDMSNFAQDFVEPIRNTITYWHFGLGDIITILLLPMWWGFKVTFLANHRKTDGDPFDITHLFDGYRDFVRIFCSMLLLYLIICIGLCLLIIPGIWAMLAFGITPYILRDYPDLKNQHAMRLSREMMAGHKWELFVLWLSFIGWFILSLFTLGIGFFWLCPYIQSSIANFYEEVKRDYEGAGIEEAEVVEEAVEEPSQEGWSYDK